MRVLPTELSGMTSGTLSTLTHPSLDLPGVRHGFFTREGGVSSGLYASLNGGLGSADEPAHVLENRARMARSLDVVPERFVTCHQVHSADVVTVVGPWARHAAPKADAMVTREPGIAIAAATADCGPVLYCDAEARVVGASHSGWKGALTGVLEATLGAMESLGAKRDHVVAVLGPTISAAAYEVGSEFVTRFVEAEPDNHGFFTSSQRLGHALFDLPAYIGHRLRRAGVGRFSDLGLCTYSDEARFFSYRRTTHRGEPDYGRLLHAIALA